MPLDPSRLAGMLVLAMAAGLMLEACSFVGFRG